MDPATLATIIFAYLMMGAILVGPLIVMCREKLGKGCTSGYCAMGLLILFGWPIMLPKILSMK